MPVGFKIASAWVDITADTSGLKRDAESGIKRALRGLEGKVKINADTSKLRKEAELAVKRATRGLSGDFKLGVDTDALRADIEKKIKRAARGLKISIPIHADSTGLREQLRLAIAAASVGMHFNIPIRVDSRPVLNAFGQINNAANKSSGNLGRWGKIAVASIALVTPALGASLHILQAMGPATGALVAGFSMASLALAAVAVGGNGVAHAIGESAESAKDFEKAMSHLTPEAQKFVRAVVSSKGAFKDLQKSVQNVLFKDLDDSFRNMASVIIPDLRIGLGGMADQLNTMTKSAMDTVTNLSRMGLLKTMFGGLQIAFDPLVAMPGQFLNMLTKLTIAGTPLLIRMTDSFGAGVEGVNAKINRLFESGQLQASITKSGDAIVNFFKRIANNPEWNTFVSNVKETGPAMADALGRIAEALLKVVNTAGPLAGVLIQVAAAFADVIISLPDSLITVLMSAYLAMKLIGTVGTGVALAAGAVSKLAAAARLLGSQALMMQMIAPALTRIGMTYANVSRVATALRGVGTAASLAAAGAAAAYISYSIAHDLWGKTPQSVDEATRAIAAFGDTNELGSYHVDRLSAAVRRLSGDRDTLDKIYDVGTFHKNDEWKKAEGDIDAYDKALAGLVKDGKLDLAASGFQELERVLSEAGMSQKDITKYTDDYRNTLANQEAANKLAAQTMGTFGERAIETGRKLSSLKADTDGLTQSLFAMNNVNRDNIDALGDWEQSADALTEQANKHVGALSYANGVISQNTQEQRDNVDALNAHASATESAGLASYEANGNWAESQKIWKSGHDDLVNQGKAMGLNATEAKAYADIILKVPTEKETRLLITGQAQEQIDSVFAAFNAAPDQKTITVDAVGDTAMGVLKSLGYTVTKLPDGRFDITANSKDAKADLDKLSKYKISDKDIGVQADTKTAVGQLDGVIKKIKETPGSKSVTIAALNEVAIKALNDTGFKVKSLPNGKFTITANTGAASKNISGIQAQRDRLSGKTITITTVKQTVFTTTGSSSKVAPVKRDYATGGSISGPGTSTSDSILARLSDGEYVIKAAAVAKYGVGFMDAINNAKLPKFSVGGYTKKRTVGKGSSKSTQYYYQGQWMTKEQYDKAHGAAAQMGGLTTFSHFGQMAKAQGSYKDNEFENMIGQPESVSDLVGNLNQTRNLIATSTSGKTEAALLKQLDTVGKKQLANQKKLEGVNGALDKAKTNLDSLRTSFDTLKNSVKSNILGFANITKVGSYGTSVDTILAKLRGDTGKSAEFATMLEQLKAKGLDANILSDIGAAGIAGGGSATARSLLNATPEQIAEINKLQGQLTTAADAAGTAVADSMYGAGIRAGEGLVKGLMVQQSAIEATMMAIAKSMEAAIKKALGIKSPSKRMEPIGDFAMQGVEVGWTKRLAKGKTLLSGKADRLTIPGQTGAGSVTASSAGGGDTHISFGDVNVRLEGAYDLTNPVENKKAAVLLAVNLKEELRKDDKKRK